MPLYQRDGQATHTTTTITSSATLNSVRDNVQRLFKDPPPDSHVIVTAATVFHPQGGGQPTDTGTIASSSQSSQTFIVDAVRQEAPSEHSQIFHLGRYSGSSHFLPQQSVQLSIDANKRHYYSRLHTAGHLLGLATRFYLESHDQNTFPPASGGGLSLDSVNLVDGKASHFPNMAHVEFIGPLIDGKFKDGIQQRLDDYIAADFPVRIYELGETDLRDPSKKIYYVPEQFPIKSVEDGGSGKLRCVSIGDLGGYPCGGTHVLSTKDCGKVTVKKIGRQGGKGISKISYSVDID